MRPIYRENKPENKEPIKGRKIIDNNMEEFFLNVKKRKFKTKQI